MLVKSYVFCPGVLGLCGLLSMNEDNFIDFIDVCYMYDVHYNLPKFVIKNNIIDHIFLMYHVTMDLFSVVRF